MHEPPRRSTTREDPHSKVGGLAEPAKSDSNVVNQASAITLESTTAGGARAPASRPRAEEKQKNDTSAHVSASLEVEAVAKTAEHAASANDHAEKTDPSTS